MAIIDAMIQYPESFLILSYYRKTKLSIVFSYFWTHKVLQSLDSPMMPSSFKALVVLLQGELTEKVYVFLRKYCHKVRKRSR
mmetsp:Transcript_6409/g.6913  ORF Transcript_6409/g.6913 Transcript_6409/m.6913 type:complete len:82 (+) Transcript_6409:365-610(+)